MSTGSGRRKVTLYDRAERLHLLVLRLFTWLLTLVLAALPVSLVWLA